MTKQARQRVTDRILADLSPDDQRSLHAALQALHAVSAEDHGPGDGMFEPEGLRQMMNLLPPAVHAKLWQVHELTDQTRDKPFDHKMDSRDWADALEIDHGTMSRFKTTLDSAEVAQKLVKRMSPQQAERPAHDTRREAVEDAWFAFRPRDEAQAAADHAVATAAPEMPLREALTTLVDHHEQQQ